MRKEKIGFKEAITHVRNSRPKVLPNLGFESQLKNYEEYLRKEDKKDKRMHRPQIKTS